MLKFLAKFSISKSLYHPYLKYKPNTMNLFHFAGELILVKHGKARAIVHTSADSRGEGHKGNNLCRGGREGQEWSDSTRPSQAGKNRCPSN